jgi:hypothetical protein
MHRHLTQRTLHFIALILCTTALRANAWGPDGHCIVARIAALHLTDKAKAGVDALLSPKKISDDSVASWADNVRASRPETGPWHFVDIPFDATSYIAERDCPSGQCVVAAIEHFAQALADTNTTTVARAEALRFLVHFVGDLHQPLHCAERNKDRGGNERSVIFLNRRREANLHRVWDVDIIQESEGGQHEIDYADELNSEITPEQQKAWSAGTVADWAWESHVAAVEHAYAGIPTNGPAVRLDGDYVLKNGKVIDEQLKKGGIRLAALLNKTLQ